MFDYLAMAYRDSDYTIVIAVMRLPKLIILVLKLTLVLELGVLLSSCRLPLLEHSLQLSLAVQLSGKAHKGYECCRAVTLRGQNSPWWRSCESCNNFWSSFWLPLPTQLKLHGHHLLCVHSPFRARMITRFQRARGVAVRWGAGRMLLYIAS